MKNSFFYRTLQVASVVATYSVISIWASTKHVNSISNILTKIDSLLVILAIAVALPYFCFKVLGKLYTPPAFRNPDKSQSVSSEPSQDEFNGIVEEDSKVMQYRGNRYNPEESTINNETKNVSESQPVIKYRGVNVANIVNESSGDLPDSLSAARDSQKSAKPKERIKYRGSYVD
jgi:hypothetical protein